MQDEDVVQATRQAVASLAATLDPQSDAVIGTSRGLEAIIDRQYLTEISRFPWYAVISRGHIYAVTDVRGQRISLQRLTYQLANPSLTFEEVKHVSFINKISFDCRLANLTDRIGRQAVMRNRRSKRATSSKYKGVIASLRPDGTTTWRTQIKADLLGTMAIGRVIPPFLAGCIRRIHAAIFSFWAGVMPPMPMFGRSLL